MDHSSELAAIRKLSQERAAVMADLESVTNDLRVAIQNGIRASWLSELRASKVTGIPRSTIRTWIGKT